ncbi:uncharacterized protein B0T15DRAFT_275941 [Chaetomium strumarium]|uniref:Uncharacterized protein n=1 Tax=Chaetomium strumarium TaxID=1170767 RepID=A0AAJ0GPF1_9PEZI|nr:hypothetical protein B0T15DRAFT_275941 [Chaetomium strumarium]
MANYASDIANWYGWITELSVIPSEYRYVIRMISSFFITLGLLPIVPIALLVIYDVVLWLWRHAAASRRAQSIMQTDGIHAKPRPPSTDIIASTSVPGVKKTNQH